MAKDQQIVYLTKDLRKKLKIYCASMQMTISEFLERAAAEKLDRESINNN